MKKKGIAVAGNAVVDLLYPIHGMPAAGELTTITGNAVTSTGGALCNCAMDLALLDPFLPITALGRVGDDKEAEIVLNAMGRCPNIDLSRIKREGTTSFTFAHVLSLPRRQCCILRGRHCMG